MTIANTPEIQTAIPSTAPSPAKGTTDVVIPDVPPVLYSSNRASVKSLRRTFEGYRDDLVSIWDTVRRYRVGAKELETRLLDSDDEAALNYRDALDAHDDAVEKAEAEYQAAIKPFAEAKATAIADSFTSVTDYKDIAIQALGLDSDIPTREEALVALQDWKEIAAQSKSTITTAKRSNVEIEWTLPDIQPKKDGSVKSTGSAAFRPRFSACLINNKASKATVAAGIAEELGVSRGTFVDCILKIALMGDRNTWDSADPGFEVEFTMPTINGKPAQVVWLQKAEAKANTKAEDADDKVAETEEPDIALD